MRPAALLHGFSFWRMKGLLSQEKNGNGILAPKASKG
jgi:hypothetical protein